MRKTKTMIVYALLALAALCWIGFFVITSFNLVAYSRYVFFALLGGIISTGLAAKLSVDVLSAKHADRRAAMIADLPPQARFQHGAKVAIALVVGVLFMLRNVLSRAFTDDPGPNDMMELVIGIVIVVGLVVALGAGYLRARNDVARGDTSTNHAHGPAGNPQQDATQQKFNATLTAVLFAAVGLIGVYFFAYQ
jgi:hypothetical protein